ncbi:MAG: hypothetical protein A3H54_01640 [Candidatus Yanofskybacteria bacterium RIFCSPLOWO2_02_FULL_41_13]|nr:MAG: hypothetical protein A3H54_01640 [Candidatus Yanofskybacteria bacterium RIFCSPLOWO2_02_FULL_41_13]
MVRADVFNGFFCGFDSCGSAAFPDFRGGDFLAPSQSRGEMRSNHILRNREFLFAPKNPYDLVAERSEATSESLTFPTWCAR